MTDVFTGVAFVVTWTLLILFGLAKTTKWSNKKMIICGFHYRFRHQTFGSLLIMLPMAQIMQFISYAILDKTHKEYATSENDDQHAWSTSLALCILLACIIMFSTYYTLTKSLHPATTEEAQKFRWTADDENALEDACLNVLSTATTAEEAGPEAAPAPVELQQMQTRATVRSNVQTAQPSHMRLSRHSTTV